MDYPLSPKFPEKNLRLIILLLILAFGVVAQAQNEKIDSLLVAYKHADHDSIRCRLMLEIGIQYRNPAPDSTFVWYHRAYNTAIQAKGNSEVFKFWAAEALGQLGWSERTYKGNFAQSMEYSDQALQLYEELENTSKNEKIVGKARNGIACSFLNIGHVHLSQGRYDKATEFLFKALKIFEGLKVREGIAVCYLNLGTLYIDQRSYDKSLNYYNEALKLNEELGNKGGITACYNNIGDLYASRGIYDLALEYNLKSLKIREELKDKKGIAMSYANIGDIYQNLGDYETAAGYYQKSLAVSEELGDKNLTTSTYLSLAGLNIKLADKSSGSGKRIKTDYLQEALNYADKAYSLAVGTGSVYMQNSSAKILQTIYTKQDRPWEALKYADLYTATQDSMFSNEKTKSLAEAEKKFEAEKKELQIIKLKQEKQLQSLALARNKVLIFSILAGFVFILIFLVFIYRMFLEKKRANHTIAQKNQRLEKAFEEITTQKEEIESQKNEIERISENEKRMGQMKMEFVTNISHEFRTPLTLIKSPLEKLANEEASPEKRAKYQAILNNANKLNLLVDQILDFRKFDTGNQLLNPQRNDFIGFVRSAFYAFTSLAEVKQIKLCFTAFDESLHMAFDSKVLSSALSNILSNAFKNTAPNGTVSCAILLANGRESIEKIQVNITNTGRNIPEEQLELIFEPFYQVPGTIYGTGIGLALTKELVHLHRGEVYANNLPDGVSFTLLLPTDLDNTIDFDEDVQPENIHQRLPEESKLTIESPDLEHPKELADFRKKLNKILIVEDNVELNKFLYDELVVEYKVYCAFDGEEGFKLAIEKMPDLIISDVMMPLLNGLDMCKRIKSDEKTSHIPVILSTARAAEGNIIEGISTGADDYLVKPFALAELKARVANTIAQRQLLREKFMKNLISSEISDLIANQTDALFLEKAMGLIQKNIDNPEFGVTELAEGLALSRSHLHHKITTLTNETPSWFIQSVRLKAAAAMLKSDRGNVSEIAYAVGFTNPTYFIKSFKKRFGVTPGEYKDLNRIRTKDTANKVPKMSF